MQVVVALHKSFTRDMPWRLACHIYRKAPIAVLSLMTWIKSYESNNWPRILYNIHREAYRPEAPGPELFCEDWWGKHRNMPFGVEKRPGDIRDIFCGKEIRIRNVRNKEWIPSCFAILQVKLFFYQIWLLLALGSYLNTLHPLVVGFAATSLSYLQLAFVVL